MALAPNGDDMWADGELPILDDDFVRGCGPHGTVRRTTGGLRRLGRRENADITAARRRRRRNRLLRVTTLVAVLAVIGATVALSARTDRNVPEISASPGFLSDGTFGAVLTSGQAPTPRTSNDRQLPEVEVSAISDVPPLGGATTSVSSVR